jgi:hypothetical protein
MVPLSALPQRRRGRFASRPTASHARHGITHAGLKGPAQPSPTPGEALNAGYGYLEVRCLGCDTHQTVAPDVVRRPKTTPIHELERYMRCKDCTRVRGYPYKRSHLVAFRRHQDFSERSAVDVVAEREIVVDRP